jgi:hypothetical protein
MHTGSYHLGKKLKYTLYGFNDFVDPDPDCAKMLDPDRPDPHSY